MFVRGINEVFVSVTLTVSQRFIYSFVVKFFSFLTCMHSPWFSGWGSVRQSRYAGHSLPKMASLKQSLRTCSHSDRHGCTGRGALAEHSGNSDEQNRNRACLEQPESITGRSDVICAEEEKGGKRNLVRWHFPIMGQMWWAVLWLWRELISIGRDSIPNRMHIDRSIERPACPLCDDHRAGINHSSAFISLRGRME